MKLLIDIGHPAHVHLFKNLAFDMQKNGHDVLFTCRDKEYEIFLLKKYGFNYKSFGRKYTSKVGKIWGLIEFNLKEYLSAIKFKPDIFISHGSIYAAHTAFLLRKPHISLEDTFNFEQIRLYRPFTKVVLTGDYDHPLQSYKVIRYSGYHELAYLHPNYFKIRSDLNLPSKYILIRFVSWNASHDYGHKGISYSNKIKLVQELALKNNIIISSESKLPDELLKYQYNFQPDEMHHIIGNSELVFGESSTMVSEAAVLGVPGIYIDNTGRFYTKELENKYGMVFNFTESESDFLLAVEKAKELLDNPGLKSEWKVKQKKMLADKIDVTAFLLWFVENFPESYIVMKKNINYQLIFK
ncbi:MAG: DUF354 domain-containing protein [Melioribacteraceae bacterium]|nr:DUF354 domain-containing protein [Melioribacteraceae bacterium]MCF8264845.1 DUF354 domain-containing protein [Melioribacteraceae bacterium]MCF8297308.1 DUF354 domain-containing protein [Saprospiraceae bacterium]